jgi:hypothetical protein
VHLGVEFQRYRPFGVIRYGIQHNAQRQCTCFEFLFHSKNCKALIHAKMHGASLVKFNAEPANTEQNDNLVNLLLASFWLKSEASLDQEIENAVIERHTNLEIHGEAVVHRNLNMKIHQNSGM